MPRPRTNLDAWRVEIETRTAQGQTQQEILNWLHEEGVRVARSTFQAILYEWGTLSDRTRLRIHLQDPSLLTAIHDLWSRQQLSDTQIAETLTARGMVLSTLQVQEIRLKHKWHRRNNDPEVQAASFQLAKQACWEAITIGPGRSYGRNLMYWYLKTQKGLNLRRDDIQDALHVIHQYQGRDRRPRMKPTHRRQAVFPGINFIWSVDGHSKLQNYGIDVYGAIDGFSRRILWINVGLASNTQVSVARQYLQAIRALKIRPRIIRSDRGTETAMMADMHYSLEVHHRSQLFNHNQAANPLPLRECYLYGKSTTNQRIESWWLRLITA
jgi:hypothetical protein